MAAESTRDLTQVLARALWALEDAGEPARAGTLAATGWAVLRNEPPTADPTAELTRLLTRALRALGEAGEPAHASTLAAAGWAALRHERSVDAERLTGLLHYLARLCDHADATAHDTKETTVTAEDRQLDVRSEPPARRHELIVETYTGLGPGEGFVLVNDHDPKPLYYQFAAEHAGAFSWDYLEQGPQTWRVRIGRAAPTAGRGGSGETLT